MKTKTKSKRLKCVCHKDVVFHIKHPIVRNTFGAHKNTQKYRNLLQILCGCIESDSGSVWLEK
jgi:hypothetical protein